MEKNRCIDGVGKITIKDIDYHRNGIGGCGFHVITFTQKDGHRNQNMMAVLFDTDDFGYCSVFDTDLLGQGNIQFGQNSWRGDNYEREMRKVIAEERDDFYAEHYKERQEKEVATP